MGNTRKPRDRDSRSGTYRWEFKARFRRRAFGWKSRPAIERVRQAVAEINKVARRDAVLGAEGAVSFLERVAPALEHVDSSSGAMGRAVNAAIDQLVPIIANAPADAPTRDAWLDRLFDAHGADDIPYIEKLADGWGELCGSKETASVWADRLLDVTRTAPSRDTSRRGYFHGTSACLSALYRAERFEEIVDLLESERIWPHKRWSVMALAAMGRKGEAIRCAESCRGAWTADGDVDALCEEILLSSGLSDEAYERYGLYAHRKGTYLATFRAVGKRYPDRDPGDILADLVETTPGEEGKWLAAAKEAGLYDEALRLAARTPCDPRTLVRAARDLADEQPAFAVGAGLLALRWLAEGYGYEITGADVRAAYTHTLQAAARNGNLTETRQRVEQLVATHPGSFVAMALGAEPAP